MKIKRIKKYTLVTVVIISIVAIAVFSTVSFFYFERSNDTVDTIRMQSDIEQAAQLAEDPNNKSTSPNNDRPSTPETTESSGKKSMPVVVSANISKGVLYIRGGLNYPVTETGSCFATLLNSSGVSIQKDTEVLQNPASTDCKTISIPTAELSPGKWKVILKYSSVNYEGSSNEVEFTIS